MCELRESLGGFEISTERGVTVASCSRIVWLPAGDVELSVGPTSLGNKVGFLAMTYSFSMQNK